MFLNNLFLILTIACQPANARTALVSDTTKPVLQRTMVTHVIEILSIKKEYDSATLPQQSFIEACNKWTLNKATITKLLQQSKPIDGHRWHYAYAVAPCNYSGQLRYHGKQGTYRLNAGAFTIITLKDTTITLGYERTDALKYFLSKPEWP